MLTMITWCFLVLAPFIASVTGKPEFCGVPDGVFLDRIVGGTDASPGEFPWMVKLTTLTHFFFCAGSLIADRYVLTAGHCIATYIQGMPHEPVALRGNIINYEVENASKVLVEVGGHLSQFDGITYLARKIIVHPEYDVFSSHKVLIQVNDIALIKTDPIVFSSVAIPICLPDPGDRSYAHEGTELIVTGWGSTVAETLKGKKPFFPPDVLKKTAMKIVPFEKCSHNPNVGMHFSDDNGIKINNTFCLAGDDTDSCRGDSGGPAFLPSTSGAVIIGIVSWGLGCNQPNFPGLYTVVSSFLDFIEENTNDGIFLPKISSN